MTITVGGRIVTFRFKQSAGGANTVTFPAGVRRAGGAFTLTAAANAEDTITFKYLTSLGVWEEIGRAQNIS